MTALRYGERATEQPHVHGAVGVQLDVHVAAQTLLKPTAFIFVESRQLDRRRMPWPAELCFHFEEQLPERLVATARRNGRLWWEGFGGQHAQRRGGDDSAGVLVAGFRCGVTQGVVG